MLDVVKRLSANESAFQRIPINSDNSALHTSQQKILQNTPIGKVELSLVDSIVKMWKLRWLIIRSRSEIAANKVLKKFKHLSGDFIFSRSSTWRSSALEGLMRPVKDERNRIHAELESEQLLEGISYNTIICCSIVNCNI